MGMVSSREIWNLHGGEASVLKCALVNKPLDMLESLHLNWKEISSFTFLWTSPGLSFIWYLLFLLLSSLIKMKVICCLALSCLKSLLSLGVCWSVGILGCCSLAMVKSIWI